VPIVIHNAIDVARRGQYVFRPATVKVTVLPAVDTSDWHATKMDKYVEMVRDLFLIELDQMQFQPSREESILAAERAAKTRAEARKNVQKKSKVASNDKVVIAKSLKKKSPTKARRSAALKKQSAKVIEPDFSTSTDNQNGIKKTAKKATTVRTKKASTTKRSRRRRTRKADAPKVSARTLDSW